MGIVSSERRTGFRGERPLIPVGMCFKPTFFNTDRVIPSPTRLKTVAGKANETHADRTNPVTRKITAAMGDTDENHPFHMRVRIEDQRLFGRVVRRSVGVKEVCVALEDGVHRTRGFARPASESLIRPYCDQ